MKKLMNALILSKINIINMTFYNYNINNLM